MVTSPPSQICALEDANEIILAFDALCQPMPDRAERTRAIAHLIKSIQDSGLGLGEDPFPLEHTFTPGIYSRKVVIPAGMIIVGKKYLTEHPVFMLSGDVSILTEDGVERVTGPQMLISPVGVQRVGYTHEEVVWVNAYPNPDDLTDIDEIMAKHTEVLCLDS